MIENSDFDKKSLKVVQGSSPDWNELAKDCVAFANAYGGEIHIGIEDDEEQPPAKQKVKDATIEKINKIISQRTINAGASASKQYDEMVSNEVLIAQGENKGRRYYIDQKSLK